MENLNELTSCAQFCEDQSDDMTCVGAYDVSFQGGGGVLLTDFEVPSGRTSEGERDKHTTRLETPTGFGMFIDLFVNGGP